MQYYRKQDAWTLKEATRLMQSGQRLAAIKVVRTWLRDCQEKSRFNDAIDWAERRGLSLGMRHHEWRRHNKEIARK